MHSTSDLKPLQFTNLTAESQNASSLLISTICFAMVVRLSLAFFSDCSLCSFWLSFLKVWKKLKLKKKPNQPYLQYQGRQSSIWAMSALGGGLGQGLVRQLEALRAQSQELLSRQETSRQKSERSAALRELLADLGARDRRLRASLRRKRERELIADAASDEVPLAARKNHRKALSAAAADDLENGDVVIATVADLIRERSRKRALEDENEAETGNRQDNLKSRANLAVDDEDKAEPGSLRSSATLGLEVAGTRETVSLRALADVQLAYRLAGISMFRTQATRPADRMMGLRIDASHEGRYHERYYMIFKTYRRAGKSEMELQRHTLPHFIPVEDLYVEFEFAEFVRRVQAYANAFVTRREQTRAIVNAHEEGDLEANTGGAYDVITFAGVALKQARIRVMYKTLLDTVPDEVQLFGKSAVRVRVSSLPQPPMGLSLAHVFKESTHLLEDEAI